MASDDVTTSPVGVARRCSAGTSTGSTGVRSGDFAFMLAELTDDAELVFEGIPVGPFRGREAIRAAYRSQPRTTSSSCCVWTRTATVVPAGRMPGPSARAWSPARSR